MALGIADPSKLTGPSKEAYEKVMRLEAELKIAKKEFMNTYRRQLKAEAEASQPPLYDRPQAAPSRASQAPILGASEAPTVSPDTFLVKPDKRRDEQFCGLVRRALVGDKTREELIAEIRNYK